jgi:small subunit ribosomal protein S18
MDITKNLNKSEIEKEVTALEKFTTQQGKILPRKVTKLNSQEQKKIQKKIKLARAFAFMPYIRRDG